MSWLLIALLLIALLLVAWLTAAATAVRSVSRIWLRHWAERQLGGSMTNAYLDQPQRLLLAAGTGTAIVVALAGAVLGTSASNRPLVFALGIVASAAAFLLVGQLVPRAIARRWTPRLIPILLPPLHAAAFVLGPVLRIADRMAGKAIHHRGGTTESASEGIQDLLREGELEGIGEPEEIDIITGVVEFGEKVLRDVMTTRTDVFAIDAATPPAEMARAIARSGYSRVPIYRDSLDEIIGMVHVFDVLRTGGEQRPFVHNVVHAPATKRCSEMLFEMLRGQQHMAVVLDEFGGTAGIVTLEDVLEELVGDIRDEHDDPVLPAVPTGGDADAAVIDASTALDDVARRFGVELSADAHGGVQSLGGVVVRSIGRIPALGERFRLGDLELTIIAAEPARLLRVLVQRASSSRTVDLQRVR
ncbi:MAG TPA: hemolysin family protein [Gemmatimonadaceae bacterium]